MEHALLLHGHVIRYYLWKILPVWLFKTHFIQFYLSECSYLYKYNEIPHILKYQCSTYCTILFPFITIISKLIQTATKSLTSSSLVMLSSTGQKMFAERFCESCTFHSALAEICSIFPFSFSFPSYKTISH